MRTIALVSLCGGLLACGLDPIGLGTAAPEDAGTRGDDARVGVETPDAATAEPPGDGAANQAPPDGATVQDAQTPPPEASSGTPPVEASVPGCTGPADCPVGQACSPSNHTCSPSCAGGLTCNGGCCDGTTCQAGTADQACGNDGQSCTDCTSTKSKQHGGACIHGSICGCPSGGDCQGGGGS